MAGFDSWQYLVWKLWSLVLTVATIINARCTDKHRCEVDITSQNAKIGFLTPRLCCEDIELPFTLLANFFELEFGSVSFHLHEYYLLDVRVRVCEEDFIDHHDSRILSTNTINNYCMDYLPDDCHGYFGPGYETYSHVTNHDPSSDADVPVSLRHMRDFDFTFPVYINITIPSSYELLRLPHDPYSSRDMFNITYEVLAENATARVPEMSSYAYLQHCKYNGFPELQQTENGMYRFKCVCMANTSGETCEWGGACPDASHTDVCSHHGLCQYQRGENVCVCDEDYFGRHCEHHESTAPEYNGSCRGVLECQHTCHIAGNIFKCQCRAGYKLINKTHCQEMDDLWDVTVKVQDYHQNISLKEKTYRLLQKAGLEDLDISVPPNSSNEMKVHFAVKNLSLVPAKSVWEDALMSSVSLTYQDVLWIGPVRKEVRQSSLVLMCNIYGNLPLMIDWYKDHYHIYTFNINSSSVSRVTEGMYTIKYYEGMNAKDHSVELWVEGHNPSVDWGSYTCQAADHHHKTVARTVVADLVPPLQVEVLPYVIRIEKNGNATLSCNIKGDWDGGRNYKFSWVVTSRKAVGHYFHDVSSWNRSNIYIYNIQQSVSVKCEVKVKENLCSDSVTNTGSNCVMVHILQLQHSHCPPTASYSTFWQATPADQTDETVCPEGFEGKAKRKCQLLSNQSASWSTPDFSDCSYRPLLNILQTPELVLQARGYEIRVEDVAGLARQLLQLLQERDTRLLPGECTGVLAALDTVFNPRNMPVNLDVFLSVMQQIMKMMRHTSCVSDVWKLYDLTKLNIISVLKHPPPPPLKTTYHVGDMVAKVATLQLQSNADFAVDSPSEYKSKASLRVDVTVLEQTEELSIGAVMYLHPNSFATGMSMLARPSVTNMPEAFVISPAVEVVGLNLVNHTQPPLNHTLVSTLSFLGLATHAPASRVNITNDYEWTRKCGAAELENNTVVWYLNRCTTSHQDGSRGSYRCECRGPGRFGLVRFLSKVTKPQLPDPAWNLTVVTSVCSVSTVVLILLCLVVRLARSRTAGDERCSGVKNALDSYLKRLRYGVTLNTHPDVNVETDQEQETLEITSNEDYYYNPKRRGLVMPDNTIRICEPVHKNGNEIIFSRTSEPTRCCAGGSNSNRSHQPLNNNFQTVQRNGVPREPIAVYNNTDNVYLDMAPNRNLVKKVMNKSGCSHNVHKYVNVSINHCGEPESSHVSDAALQKEMPSAARNLVTGPTNPFGSETPSKSATRQSESHWYLPMTVKMSK
ncbi:uncharacterized protein [Procambarus clarkii]|uniref:uncharacterized protein isoform X2 n=1 Tax=Procambarus clarkii TaxID=6728 RepID=UPI0037428410